MFLPSNLLYISAWLKLHGVETELFECSAHNLDCQSAIEVAKTKEFDFVCFTSTNLDFLFVIEWIRAFHNEFHKPIMVGGPGAENYPGEMAQHDQIQAVFHSPAEACMVPWLKAYIEKQEWWKVPGTACKYENKIYLNDQIALPRKLCQTSSGSIDFRYIQVLFDSFQRVSIHCRNVFFRMSLRLQVLSNKVEPIFYSNCGRSC